jgi:hypothetical protein
MVPKQKRASSTAAAAAASDGDKSSKNKKAKKTTATGAAAAGAAAKGDAELDYFKGWCVDRGVSFHPSLELRNLGGGGGGGAHAPRNNAVFAAGAIKPGDVLCRIPKAWCLTARTGSITSVLPPAALEAGPRLCACASAACAVCAARACACAFRGNIVQASRTSVGGPEPTQGAPASHLRTSKTLKQAWELTDTL